MDGWTNAKHGSKYAGVSEGTFRGWLKQGLEYSKLPTGSILIRYQAIDAFLEQYAVVDRIMNEIFNRK